MTNVHNGEYSYTPNSNCSSYRSLGRTVGARVREPSN
jgi:hypothetical protein